MGKKQIIITYVRPSSQAITTRHQESTTSLRGRVRRRMEVNVQCPRGWGLPRGRLLPLLLCKELKNLAWQSREGTSAADLAEYERRCRTEASPTPGGGREWSIISVTQDFHNVAWGASSTEPWGNWDSEGHHMGQKIVCPRKQWRQQYQPTD